MVFGSTTQVKTDGQRFYIFRQSAKLHRCQEPSTIQSAKLQGWSPILFGSICIVATTGARHGLVLVAKQLLGHLDTYKRDITRKGSGLVLQNHIAAWTGIVARCPISQHTNISNVSIT